MKKNPGFLKDAFVISLGGLLSKAIGAVYKIPLNSFIGCEGAGLYQLAYPFYCFILTLTSSGATSSVAKLTAEDRGAAEGAFRKAILLFAAAGGAGCLFMAAGGKALSAVQGQDRLFYSYLALSPSVLFVAIISVYRGWLHGRGDMLPAAFSEVAESGIRAFAGIFFTFFLNGDVYADVSAALLAVTFGEFFAMAYLFSYKKKIPDKAPLYKKPVPYGDILRTALPVTFSQAIPALFSVADGIVIIKLLSSFSSSAVEEYGIFSGGAIALLNLPVTAVYGVAAAILPKIAAAGRREEKKSALYALLLTFALAVPCVAALNLFGGVAIKILYRRYSPAQRESMFSILKTISASALFISMAQTLSACLTAEGRAGEAAINTFISSAVKTALLFIFVNEKNGVVGVGYALNICNFLLFMLNLICVFFIKRKPCAAAQL